MQRGRPLFFGIAHRVRGREAGGACAPRWALPGPLGTVVEKKRGHLRKLGVGVGPKAGFSRIRSWGLVRALGNMPGVHGFGATCFSRIPNRCYVCEMPIVSRFKADVIQLRGPSGREGVLEARAGRCQPKSRSPSLSFRAQVEKDKEGRTPSERMRHPCPRLPTEGKTKCGSDYFECVSGEGRYRASFSAPCHFER
jgi:hypothetical protein